MYITIGDLRSTTLGNTLQPSAIMMAIKLEPDDAHVYSNRGAAKADLGQYSAAVSDYDKAIQLKPILLMHISIVELQRANLVNTSQPSAITIRQYNLNPMLPMPTTIGDLRSTTLGNTLQPSAIMTRRYNLNPIMPMHISVEELRRLC